jgi:hypothetical protein
MSALICFAAIESYLGKSMLEQHILVRPRSAVCWVLNEEGSPSSSLLTRFLEGKKDLIVAGVTTDVCLVPPALSMQAEGFLIKVSTVLKPKIIGS